SVAKPKPKRQRRRPDPFVTVTAELREWFEAEPWLTSREFFERLQAAHPGNYPDGQLRTLQRRLKEWRRENAINMVFGIAKFREIPEQPKKLSKSSAEYALGICRFAWTTLTRRPQLHRAHNIKTGS